MIKNNYSLSEPFNYENDLEFSKEEPLLYWNEVSKKYIHWDKPYQDILYRNDYKSEWFKGGMLNACYNILDKHIINGRGNEIAFIQEIPLEDISYSITYKELYEKVTRFSRSLKNLGIKKGDVVFIYMHNSIETVISMLSCSRIGAIHFVIWGGYQCSILSEAVDRCKPSLIITANYGYIFDSIFYYFENIKNCLKLSKHQPGNVIVYNRNDFKDKNNYTVDMESKINNQLINWDDLVNQESIEPLIEYELVESNHPLYIMFSSGTTNKPKLITRDTGSYLVACSNYINVSFGLNQGDTYFSKSAFAWMNGASVLLYGCLLIGVKSIFAESSMKDSVDYFWNFIEKYEINAFSTAPIGIRCLMKYDTDGKIGSKYKFDKLRKIVLNSEKSHQNILDYLYKVTGKEMVCIELGQSETGVAITSNPSNKLPIINDSINKATIGYQLKIVSKSKETGDIIENQSNEIGNIVIKLPLPPSVTNRFFDDDSQSTFYKNCYLNKFPGYFDTGDLGYYDSNGYFYYVSRSGEYINVGGYTINTSVIENEILKHSKVYDCSVIGLKDEIMGQYPMGFIVLHNSNENVDKVYTNNLKNEINQIIEGSLSYGSNLKSMVILKELPRNRNGKKIKSLLNQIFNGLEYSIPSSLDNVEIIDILLEEFKKFQQ